MIELGIVIFICSIVFSCIALGAGSLGHHFGSIFWGTISIFIAYLFLDGLQMLFALSFAFLSMGPSFTTTGPDENPLSRIHGKGFSASFIVLILVLGVTGSCFIYPIFQSIEMETSYDKMFPKDEPLIEEVMYAESRGFGGLSPVHILIKGEIINTETWNYIWEIEEQLKRSSDYEYIINVVSIVDVIYPDGKIPNSTSDLRNDVDSIPKSVRNLFLSRDSQNAVIYITTNAGATPESSNELKAKLESNINKVEIPVNIETSTSGVPLMSQKLSEIISLSQIIVAILSIGFLVLYLSFSMFGLTPKISIAFSLLLSISFAIIGTFIIIGYQGRSINISIPILLTLVFGVGIDDGLHLLKRFRDVLGDSENENDMESSIKQAISDTGGAAFATTATTIIALSTLTLAPIPILQEFAPIAVVGMLLSFVSMTIIFPYLIKIDCYNSWLLPIVVFVPLIIVSYFTFTDSVFITEKMYVIWAIRIIWFVLLIELISKLVGAHEGGKL